MASEDTLNMREAAKKLELAWDLPSVFLSGRGTQNGASLLPKL